MPTREFSGESRISCDEEVAWGENVNIGPDVNIHCRRLFIGDNVQIGSLDEDDSFRYRGGVRIRVDDLVLGNGVQIGRHVLIQGGNIEIGRRVKIKSGVTIRVDKQLVIGAEGTVHEHAEIAGLKIVIGRQLWMLPHAKIGGGSAFEVHSNLEIGDWCHLGVRSLLNTARPITIGDEVGLGTSTSLHTHGVYASALDGKPFKFGPISIGNRTWIPGAIVNPSVMIGEDCVIGVGSVVTSNIAKGSLAAGIPARVIKKNAYPAPLSKTKRFAFFLDFMLTFSEICADRWKVRYKADKSSIEVMVGKTRVCYCSELAPQQLSEWLCKDHVIVLSDDLLVTEKDIPSHATLIVLTSKQIIGKATPITERLLSQLRRYGIRFNYGAENGRYAAWD